MSTFRGSLRTYLSKQIINLSKDIAQHGLSPIDGVLILPGGEDVPGDYVVWEGNRRVTALKLLDDPNRCPDSKYRKIFTMIRGKAKVEIPQHIECVIAPSLEEADRLVELRHQGPQDGVGTVPWDGQQKTRHQQRLGKRGRYAFSQNVLDAITDKLDDELKRQVQTKGFSISTLDRILSNTYAREFLGLSTEGGLPQRVVDEKEALKGLARVIRDIAGGMPVSKIYNGDLIRDYLGTFDKKDIPDKKKKLSDPVPLASHGSGAITPAGKRTRSRSLASERKKLIPQGVSYSIQENRINSIYAELRRLDVGTHRNAVAVLFRVFLELSVNMYLDKNGLPYQAFSDKIKTKAGKVVADMTQKGWLSKAGSKGINVAISDNHTIHSFDTFNAYVHSYQYHPAPSELRNL